ncbi:MAG: hypothetical protein MK188_06580 [Gammaproteobacteria bacterium]|nr:hypothetical protein [Gammaproteobacteria bacterium]
MIRSLLFLIALFIISDSKASGCKATVEGLKELLNKNSINTEKRSMLDDEYRYLAVYGHGFRILGLSKYDEQENLSFKNYVVVEGSGENFCDWPQAPVTVFQDINNHVTSCNKTIAE